MCSLKTDPEKVRFSAKSSTFEKGFAEVKGRLYRRADCISLGKAEMAALVAEVVRNIAVSERTFYRWKKKYSGLEVDQVRQLKQMREENARLKRIVADLTLDKAMLQDVLTKKF